MNSTDFEWETDEEETGVVRPVVAPRVRRSWPWRLVLAVVLVATAVILGIRWRTARQTAAITADVQIAHALVQEAEAAQDVELLNLVLSGRELGWQEAQQQLMVDGNFASRPAFGLQAVPATNGVPQVELSPDLKEVLLVSPQVFVAAGGEEVVLQQTAVYRQGTRNWLLSPPEEAFWGQTLITHTRYFTVTYPQRDGIWVQRLVADWDTLFAEQLCGRIWQCQPNLKFDLRFSTSPQSLVTVNNPLGLLLMADSVSLPTPTLVGLPVAEAGYAALYQGYGAQMVTAVLAHLFAYDCCNQALMTQALLTKQASELGLRTWPLTATDYGQLLNFTFANKSAEELLAEESIASVADHQQAYALVDFLMTETEWSPTQLVSALLGNNGATLFLPALVREDGFADRWLAFVHEQSGNGRQPSPTAAPPPIYAACQGPQGAVLYRYDLSNKNQTVVDQVTPPYIGTTRIWPLPVADGYMVREEIYRRFELEARLTLHYQGEATILLQQILTELYPLPEFGFTGETDPNGRYLVLFANSRSRQAQSHQFLLDLSTCNQNRCTVTALTGQPLWSPDGRQTLIVSLSSPSLNDNPYEDWPRELARGNDTAQVEAPLEAPVSRGYAPAWLDNGHYSYLRFNDEGLPEWVVAATTDDVPQVQLQAADLLTAVPANSRPPQLFMVDTATAAPNQVAIIAATELLTDSLDYVFLWDRTNSPQLMQVGEGLQVGFSPNGRWLTITTLDGTVTLIDTTTGDQQQFHSPTTLPDWTTDSQWLLTGRQNYLLLTAPDDGYQQIVFNQSSSCHQISWGE